MNIKIKKSTLKMAAFLTSILLLNSCKTPKQEIAQQNDCSSIFETRYIDNKTNEVSNIYTNKQQTMGDEMSVPSECKILEVKLSDNITCELVGSSRIESLTKILDENKSDKIIFITPESKFSDLGKMAQNYLNASGIDINKHFDSEVFKNMSFPYRGTRCKVDDKEFVIWKGGKKIVVTIDNI